jgi:hypothetical protein
MVKRQIWGQASIGRGICPLVSLFPPLPNSLLSFIVKNQSLVRGMTLAQLVRCKLKGESRQIIWIKPFEISAPH